MFNVFKKKSLQQAQRMRHRSLITALYPQDPLSEAYRMIRTNLGFSAIDKQIQSILFTSALPGEGKSTTIANLAVTLAQSGKRTLLVDGDLRKPSLHHFFRYGNHVGLTSALIDSGRLNDSIQNTDVPNLYLLSSGPLPPNPSELLSSSAMRKLMVHLYEQFDYVLVDSPPLLLAADGQVLSRIVDGVVLVVKYASTKKEQVVKAKDLLVKANASILGVILNQKKYSANDDYAYYHYYGEA